MTLNKCGGEKDNFCFIINLFPLREFFHFGKLSYYYYSKMTFQLIQTKNPMRSVIHQYMQYAVFTAQNAMQSISEAFEWFVDMIITTVFAILIKLLRNDYFYCYWLWFVWIFMIEDFIWNIETFLSDPNKSLRKEVIPLLKNSSLK